MNQYSGFYSLHPAVAFTFYVGFFLFSMLFLHPVFLMAALVTVILLNFLHDKGRSLKRSLLFYVITCLFIGIINPLFSHRGAHILFYLFDQPVTLEAVLFGFVMMLSILIILIGFLSFNLIINESKLMHLFSSITPKAALLVIMAIRFVPLLKRRLTEITYVQKTRGISIHQGSVITRAKNGMKLLHILLTWSLEEALQTADSMKARGYGLRKRSSYFSYNMDRRDYIVLLITIVLGLICLICWNQGYGILQIYPSLESMTFSGMDMITFMVFIAYMLIPVTIEVRELIRWRYIK